jgi:hypothetical protein
MVSAVRAGAQDKAATPASRDFRGAAFSAREGPLKHAATREAARLATADGPETFGVEVVAQSDRPARFGWAAIRTLGPGTEVIVAVKGSPPVERYVVGTDESNLTLLNLSDPTLSRAVTRVLLSLASAHPEYLTGTSRAGQFVDHDVRAGPDGVFEGGRRVAEIGQLVQTFTQSDVAEIRIR